MFWTEHGVVKIFPPTLLACKYWGVYGSVG